MADRTECNYEEMQAISKQLQNEASAMNQLLSATRSKADALHGADWIGRGADSFFAEMNDLVLPSMARLVDALEQSVNITNQIVATYQQAEAEAQNGINAVDF